MKKIMIDDEIPIDLWDRQPGESLKAYKAFDTFLKMGYKRSLKRLCIALGIKTYRHISDWKKTFKWEDRIVAYENEQSRLQTIANIEVYKTICEKQLSLASNLRQIINIPLQIISERMKRDSSGKVKAIDDFNNLTTVELYELLTSSSRYLDIVVKVERLAIGQPTEIKREESVNNQHDTFNKLIAGDEHASKLYLDLIDAIAENEDRQSNDNGS